MVYWQKIVTGEAQKPRHNVHILDNSILSKLYKLEEVSHPVNANALIPVKPSSHKELPAPQVQRQFVSKLRCKTNLFDPVLNMFTQGDNILVIPESVLRECYRNTFGKCRCPFRSNKDGEWTWDYASTQDIECQQDKLQHFWDDRALLLSHFLHEKFEREEIAVCRNAEDFAEQFSHYHPHAKVVIVCDGQGEEQTQNNKKQEGDNAIRHIVQQLDSARFPSVSALTTDIGLTTSLYCLHEGIVPSDMSVIMDAFCKYSNSSAARETKPWNRDEMNTLFAAAHAKNKDFPYERIAHYAMTASDALLNALGLGAQQKDSGRGGGRY